ncbi:Ig-like domain-containing protein, partial [Alphaproteobacteria bacterium]|nr:Ig-like domain-containing protein [Alphaproteobacteria bacterium]
VEAADASSQEVDASGTIYFEDLDSIDSLTISTGSIVVAGSLGVTVASSLSDALIAAVSVSEGEQEGQANWSIDTSGLDLDFLGDGETITVTVPVIATDESNASVTEDAVITITGSNDAPVVTSTPETSGTQDAAYSYTFAFSGVDSGGSHTLAATTRPNWLSFNDETGVLSGTPSDGDVGDHAVVLTVTDADGVVVTQSFSVAVANVVPFIDTVAITGATNAANNLLNEGDVVSVTVTMNEATDVDVSNGSPFITLTIGGTTKQAAYASGTGTTSLVFTYTIEAGLTDADGISIGQDAITLNGATLRDGSGADATLTHASVAANSSYGVDTTAPSISDVITSFGESLNATEDNSDATATITTIGVEDGQTVTLTTGGRDYTGTVSNNSTVITFPAADLQALSEGANSYAVNVSDAAGNAAVESAGSFPVDTLAPSISDTSFSFGESLNAAEDNSERSATITTIGVEDGQTVTLTIASVNYTGTVSNNSAFIAVPAADLQALSEGTQSYAVNVSDEAGNAAVESTGSFPVDTTAPTVTISLSDTSLIAGETATVTFTFSEVPLSFEIDDIVAENGDISDLLGSDNVYTAIYTPNSNTTDAANDLYVVNMSYTDAAGNVGSNAFAPNFAIDTNVPNVSSVAITSASGAANGYLNAGDIVSVTVAMDEATIVTGSPFITLTIGGTTKQASYASGTGTTSLVFTYTIEAGLTDADGISIGQDAIALNSGTLRDAAGNDATLAHSSVAANSSYGVDTTAPTVIITMSDTALKIGDTSLVIFTFSETPIGFAEGDITAANGDITSLQVDGSNPNVYTATFTPTSDITDASNIISVSTAYSDAAGNTGVGNDSANFTIDTGAPSVSSVAITSATNAANNLLNAGDVVSVTVTMDEATNVVGSPFITLTIGGTTKQASYASGTGTTSLVFTYTIEAGLTDADGISIGQDAIALNSGTLRDAAGNDATLAHSSVAANSSYGVDTTAPSVSSVAITDTDGLGSNLTAGDGVSVTLTMDEATVVTGTPTIELNIGGIAKNASYVSGSGSTALVFTYVLESGLADADGISISQNSLALNGGSLSDAAGNAIALSHSAAAANASYLVNTLADNVATPLSYAGKTQGETRNESAFAAILEDGTVVAWGDAQTGGDVSGVSGLFDVVAIYSTGRAFAALTSSGAVVTWGNSLFGGDSSAETGSLAGGDLLSGVAQVYSSSTHFVALKTDGTLVSWGYDLGGMYVAPSALSNVVSISSNSVSFAAILGDGSVVAWGASLYGGDTSAVSAHLDGTVDVTEIVATETAFAAIKADGSVVTWGSEGGDSSAVSSALDGTNDVVAIYASKRAFVAVHEDGTVTSWGTADYGADTSGVDFNGSADDLSISAVYSTDSAFAALLSDGSVVTWGNASEGGNYGSALTGVETIVATESAFAALKSDGSVVAWGDAGGTIGSASVSSNVIALYANDGAFAALKSDGSVVTWGNASSGGDTSASALAVELDGTAGQEIVSISTSNGAFVALRADGSLVTWGSDVTDGVVQSGGSDVATAVAIADMTDKEAVATLSVSSATGTIEEGALLTANLGTVTDADGSTSATYQWQVSSDNINWSNVADATTTTYQIASDESQVGEYVRVVVSTLDALGGTSTITSASAEIVNLNDAPTSSDGLTNSDAVEAGTGVSSVVGSGAADALFANISDTDNVLDDFVVSRAKETSGTFEAVAANSTSASNAEAVSGLYGTLSVGADGSYSYAVDNNNGTVQALDNGDTLNDVFIIEVSDGAGGTVAQSLTLAITGSNDGPVLDVGAVALSVNEATDASAQDISGNGTITFSDLDDIASITAASGSVSLSSGVTLPDGLEASLLAALTFTDQGDNTADWDVSLADLDLDFLD